MLQQAVVVEDQLKVRKEEETKVHRGCNKVQAFYLQ